MIKRGAEVTTKPVLRRMFASELNDQAPYRWVNNRKGAQSGKMAGPIYINGTEYYLVVHVGELEAIYRRDELEVVE